ncbi:MAG TPA: YbjQ family protein [Candidatus Norongarragalinales archaeon]|nr:YbjQ family protein [Candidatus Norongarragalinales archaeon]
MIISTTEDIAGYRTEKYVGLVWASAVRSKHLGHDFYAMLKSLKGGDLSTYEHLTNQARSDVVEKLKKAAQAQGANAVVGLRFGTTQVMSATVEVYAYGTSVRVKKS